MSVVIKSNNVANNHFGQLASLNTNADTEFAKYKERVLADGGVIRDEPYTKELFEKLLSNAIYGNLATYVSGKAGVKLSGSGVAKLYSLQGEDLVAHTFGLGALPTLTSDNAIDFSGNQVSTLGRAKNGVLFTTERQIKLSKVGNFAMGIAANVAEKPTTGSHIAAITKHNDETMAAHLAVLIISNALYYFRATRHPINLTTPTQLSNSLFFSGNTKADGKTTSGGFLSRPKDPLKAGYENGVTLSPTGETNAQTFKNLQDYEFYLDFGGTWYSDYLDFYDGKVYDFYFLKEATQADMAALTR